MIAWTTLLTEIYAACGLGSSPTTDQKATLAVYAKLRLETALKRAWWPSWMQIEQRSFKPEYDAATEYAEGEQVWDGDTKYYTSLADANEGQALTDTDWWEEATEIEAVIPFADTGKVTVGTFFDAYRSEEDAQLQRGALKTMVRADNIYILSSSGPAAPWLLFRKGVPDVAPTGEGATAEDVPGEWREYIIRATKADWLNDGGKVDSAAKEESLAESSLQNAVAEQVDQQGMAPTTRVHTFGMPYPRAIYRSS